jgi:hypothetical protein
MKKNTHTHTHTHTKHYARNTPNITSLERAYPNGRETHRWICDREARFRSGNPDVGVEEEGRARTQNQAVSHRTNRLADVTESRAKVRVAIQLTLARKICSVLLVVEHTRTNVYHIDTSAERGVGVVVGAVCWRPLGVGDEHRPGLLGTASPFLHKKKNEQMRENEKQ